MSAAPRLVLPLVLALASGALARAPADPLYQALLGARPGAFTLEVHGLRLQKDVLEIVLDGRLDFAEPAGGKPWLAVFRGAGRLRLLPATAVECEHLRRLTGEPGLDALEDRFAEAVFAVTDGSLDPLFGAARPGVPDPEAARLLGSFRYLMHEEAGLHPELRILASQGGAGVFLAHFAGQRWPRLLYVLDPMGVDPGRFGPEESGLYNAGERRGSGWWYLAHLRDERRRDERHVEELRASFSPVHFQVSTRIDAQERLEAVARIRLRALPGAGRVIPFLFSERLRVREALLLPAHTPLAVVQEAGEWSDPALGVLLPAAPVSGALVELELRYAGRGIVAEMPSGGFVVGARAHWYPNLGMFHPRATYELGFCAPAGLEVVAVGELLRRWDSDVGQSCSEWLSQVPLTMAGFNYGRFRKLERVDQDSGLTLGIYTREAGAEALAQSALAGAVQSARLYTRAFGRPSFTRVSITEQPAPAFGQAWPTLVYLPEQAFPGRSQRCGGPSSKAPLQALLQAHEIAHQWWGHTVGWKTYHDEWLTEGFADFAAAFLLEKAEGRDCFEDFWRQSRDALAGSAAVGPLWLGRRLENHRNRQGYGELLYPKGSYVLHMLRMMMQGPDGGDEPFLAMLRGFMAAFRGRRCSTADFQAFVETHRTPEMDLSGDGRMDWFFRQWVYGTELPAYELEARAEAAGSGLRLRGTLRQKGVSAGFRMLVPVYADLGDGRILRVARVACRGTEPVALDLELPLAAAPRRFLLNASHDVLSLD